MAVIPERLAGLSAQGWFALFCAAHFVIWVLVPSLMYHNLPHDTLEAIAWGNMWLAGYDKHPPLAPWLSALASDLGGTVGWPVFVLSQLSVLVCFWAVWRVALRMVDPWLALVSVVLLEGINYYNVAAFNYNPNVAMLPTWGLLSLAFYRALTRQNLWNWGLVGLCAGLAFLAKYETAVLFAVMLALLAMTGEGRCSFKGPGLYLAILVAGMVVTPNLIWQAKHDFIGLHYALGNMTVGTSPYTEDASSFSDRHHSTGFMINQLPALLPMMLLFLPLIRGRGERPEVGDFDRRFVLFLALGPLLLTLAGAVILKAELITRWAYPYFSFAGLALVAVFKPVLTQKRLATFLLATSAFSALLVFACYWVIYVRPYHTGKPPFSITYPGREIAEEATQAWHRQYYRPLKYVVGERNLVAAVASYSPDKPIPYFDGNPPENPWVDETVMAQKGALFISTLRGAARTSPFILDLKKRFPNLVDDQTRVFAQATRAPLPAVRIWYAFLPPRKPAASQIQGVGKHLPATAQK